MTDVVMWLARSLTGSSLPNILFLIAIAIAPVFASLVKEGWRNYKWWGWFLLALVLTHFGYALSVHLDYHLSWFAYERCQSHFPDGGLQSHEVCQPLLSGTGGPALWFSVFVGWIPAAIWTALSYQAVGWMRRRRETSKAQRKV